MTYNPFGFWENVHENYLFFASLHEGIEYSIRFVTRYISNIEFFPETTINKYLIQNRHNENNGLMSVFEIEHEMSSKHRFYSDFMYVDASLYNTHDNRLYPHQQYKNRGWRSANMTNYSSATIPFLYSSYINFVPHNNFPYWAFPINVDMPVMVHKLAYDAFYNTHNYRRFHIWTIYMYVSFNTNYINYLTDYLYIFTDYITSTPYSQKLNYTYDYMQTKVSAVKMRNPFFPKSNYYNDSMSKEDFLHHDYKNVNFITNNYFKTNLKNSYFQDVYGKYNPLIWKDGTQHLTGFYFMYYDCFGSPEPIWLNQFSIALENVFPYFNKTYIKFHDTSVLIDIDNSMIHYKRGHPILLYLHWLEWEKLQDDMLIFKKILEKQKSNFIGMDDLK